MDYLSQILHPLSAMILGTNGDLGMIWEPHMLWFNNNFFGIFYYVVGKKAIPTLVERNFMLYCLFE